MQRALVQDFVQMTSIIVYDSFLPVVEEIPLSAMRLYLWQARPVGEIR